MTKKKYDFAGWATKNDLKCSDGRTIRRNAFKEDDGKVVPLVWMHRHDGPENVIGHALLENRKDGVYAYGSFNNTENASYAKELVEHGDIVSLSIYANQLKQNKGDVLHGHIREVSLVLAGANPGASIEFPILEHGEESDSEAIIYSDADIAHGEGLEDELEESESTDATEDEDESENLQNGGSEEEIKHSDDGSAKEETKVADEQKKDKTIEEVFNTLNEEQKNAVYAMLAYALENKDSKDGDDEDEEDEEMKHNVFDTDEMEDDVLSHSDMEAIIKDGKRYGSLKESVLEHAEDYGIDGIEWLFPEDRNLNTTPEFIKRDTDWVSVVMSGVHHTPFSRVKSTFANITEDEARAKGYLKGHLKKEEVFSLLKRATTPQTVYKKQKIDRDDQIDITDFDVVAWIKGEMRMMLDEELARAYLIGDGRLASDDDKISEEHIRPIANDADLFTIKKAVTLGTGDAADDITARNFIKAAIKARKDYKGSGNPILFTTEDQLTNMLLLEDTLGHSLYKTEAELATKLRVSRIVTVPVMENHQVNGKTLMGIIVNLADYNVGADKGGAINMFEDFDIDYNQEKYLIETRCSGALTKPYSAIVLFASELPTSVDGGVIVSKTTYTQVTPAGTENPKALGWYEYDATAGKYVKTTDTTVDQSATYYTRKSFNAD